MKICQAVILTIQTLCSKHKVNSFHLVHWKSNFEIQHVFLPAHIRHTREIHICYLFIWILSLLKTTKTIFLNIKKCLDIYRMEHFFHTLLGMMMFSVWVQWCAQLSAGAGWCEHASQAVIQPWASHVLQSWVWTEWDRCQAHDSLDGPTTAGMWGLRRREWELLCVSLIHVPRAWTFQMCVKERATVYNRFFFLDRQLIFKS